MWFNPKAFAVPANCTYGTEAYNSLFAPNNVVWNTDDDITAYDELTAKLRHLFANADDSHKDAPQVIVNAIHDLATGESKKFRTVIGNSGNYLVSLRNSIPIEEYLETIAANF